MEDQNSFLKTAKFTLFDWTFFAVMLVISGATGLYFAYKSRKKATDMQEYLMGSRNMKTLPVAMSLLGSYISGVTIMGTPAEIYNFGMQYSLIVLSILISGVIVAVVYLPVYFKLQIRSSYEYLELRFDKSLRVLASILFLFDEILFLPIVIYVPALAFNQVTGIDVYIVGSSVCLLCIFYTVLGGLKAVVWTDTWQVAIMIVSVILFSFVGTIQAGGIKNVFESAKTGDRLDFFIFDIDPYRRHSIWGVIIGGVLYWTAFNAINMTMVQRYLSLPNRQQAEKSMVYFSVCAALIIMMCCYTGLLIYERLGLCDPKATNSLSRDDQLLPAYIAIVSKHIPGVLGIFIAGIFGAALSSMSVVLNSTATVVLEDLVKGLAKQKPGPMVSSIIARLTITLLGLASLGMLFVVEKTGGILNVATSLSAIAASTMFGVFTLGMLWPWANARGALVGAICGALLGSWISLGSQASIVLGYTSPDYKPPNLSGCTHDFNMTNDWPAAQVLDPNSVFFLYKISYHWIAPIGILTTFVIGASVSACTKSVPYTKLDPELFSPVIHRFFPQEMMRNAGKATRGVSRTNDNDEMIPMASTSMNSEKNLHMGSSSQDNR